MRWEVPAGGGCLRAGEGPAGGGCVRCEEGPAGGGCVCCGGIGLEASLPFRGRTSRPELAGLNPRHVEHPSSFLFFPSDFHFFYWTGKWVPQSVLFLISLMWPRQPYRWVPLSERVSIHR